MSTLTDRFMRLIRPRVRAAHQEAEAFDAAVAREGAALYEWASQEVVERVVLPEFERAIERLEAEQTVVLSDHMKVVLLQGRILELKNVRRMFQQWRSVMETPGSQTS